MRTVTLSLALVALLTVPLAAQADHDPSDAYTTIGGVLYVDDDDIPYVYLESNGEPGLQRDADGNSHGHAAHDDPDLWLV